MNVILSQNLTLERLERLFRARKLVALITELEPAVPEQALPRLAHLTVYYDEGPKVLIWLDTQIPSLLRLRSVILSRRQRRDEDDPPAEPWTLERHQQQELFGLDPSGTVRQIVIDDRLPYQGAVIDEVVISAARFLSERGRELSASNHSDRPMAPSC